MLEKSMKLKMYIDYVRQSLSKLGKLETLNFPFKRDVV